MKIKTAWLNELRGSVGKPFLGGLSCFRTDKYGNITGLKSPSEPRVPTGKQPLYRHQLRYWSLHWNFLTPGQKANYAALGEADEITGYDYYIKEHYDINNLYVAPTDNRWVELWSPDKNPTAEEYLHMSDDEDFEDWTYINFPLAKICQPIVITKAELFLRYAGEAGSSAEGKRVDCHKIVDQWHEQQITYNNRPSVAGTETDHTDMPAEMTLFSFDVTADINSLISSGILFYGWRVKFHETVGTGESMSSLRSTYPHDDDYWPFLRLSL